MSKTVKQKLITLISSLNRTQFNHFFQEYIKTVEGPSLQLKKSIQFLSVAEYEVSLKFAGIQVQEKGENISEATTKGCRKLINKLIEIGKFIDVFIMCLKRRNKDRKESKEEEKKVDKSENERKRFKTEYQNESQMKTEKRSSQLENILKRISTLEDKLALQRQNNRKLKKEFQGIKEQKHSQKKRFRTQLSEIKLSEIEENQNQKSIKQVEKFPPSKSIDASKKEGKKNVHIPKLNLTILDNYHNRSSTPLNEELLKKYTKHHQ